MIQHISTLFDSAVAKIGVINLTCLLSLPVLKDRAALNPSTDSIIFLLILAAIVGGILILIVVRQILVSRNNALLYQSETKRRQLAESLTRATQEMTSTLDFQQAPVLVLDQLAVVVPYERCSILLEQNHLLHIVAQRGFPENEQRTQEVLITIREDDPYLEMAKTFEPVIIDDVTKDPGWTILPWLPLNKSWMGIPLVVRENAIGMISVTRKEAHAFTTEDMLLAKAFAGQAAVTLENARLYAELQRAYHTLEILDNTKSKFIEIVAHELRTPLTIIKGYTQSLAAQAVIKDDIQNQTLLEGVVRGADRLHEIVNNMIDITKIDTQVLKLNKVPFRMSDLFMRLTQYYEPALSERNLTLEIDDLSQLPLIQADAELLQKVFLQLVMNAIKYTPDGGKIRISNRIDRAKNMLEIEIADTGIGIDPEQIELIFKKFYQTGQVALHSTGQTKFKGGGPGLGLPIALGIVTAHGGKIWAESPCQNEQTCPGSKFFVQLPL